MLAAAPAGPLHGVPVAVKDMYALPWRAPRDGTDRDQLPPGESAVFRALRDAGAVVVGHTNTHFWGGGSTGHVSVSILVSTNAHVCRWPSTSRHPTGSVRSVRSLE